MQDFYTELGSVKPSCRILRSSTPLKPSLSKEVISKSLNSACPVTLEVQSAFATSSRSFITKDSTAYDSYFDAESFHLEGRAPASLW